MNIEMHILFNKSEIWRYACSQIGIYHDSFISVGFLYDM